MTKYSIIIPTMWRPDNFKLNLEKLYNLDFIDEIIIISNDAPTFTDFGSKVRVLQQESNIGVNPAWNLGVREAKNEDIVLLNDDFDFDRQKFFKGIKKYKNDYAIIGIFQHDGFIADEIYNLSGRTHAFGCCMYINKNDYIPIPEQLKIYFGDDWLITTNILRGKKIGGLTNIMTNDILSVTSTNFYPHIMYEFHDYKKLITEQYNHKYRYSIVIPFSNSSTDPRTINNLLDSFEQQTFKDFEVVLIHNGPNSENSALQLERPFAIRYVETQKIDEHWEHSLRKLAILDISSGEYIVTLNCTDTLYNNALEKVESFAKDGPPIDRYKDHPGGGVFRWDSRDIIIFPIWLMNKTPTGIQDKDKNIEVWTTSNGVTKMISTGSPPVINNINCMQFVMSRCSWVQYGGWYSTSNYAESEMFPRFVSENMGAIYVDEILGEHL